MELGLSDDADNETDIDDIKFLHGISNDIDDKKKKYNHNINKMRRQRQRGDLSSPHQGHTGRNIEQIEQMKSEIEDKKKEINVESYAKMVDKVKRELVKLMDKVTKENDKDIKKKLVSLTKIEGKFINFDMSPLECQDEKNEYMGKKREFKKKEKEREEKEENDESEYGKTENKEKNDTDNTNNADTTNYTDTDIMKKLLEKYRINPDI